MKELKGIYLKMNYTDNQIEFEKKYKELDDYVKKELSEKRYRHTLSVAGEAKKLAKLNNMSEEDVRRVTLAAVFHDAAKELPKDEMNALVEKYGLDERYKGNSNLAHGKLASKLIEDRFGVDDNEIINAISFHTTGRKNMSMVERVVFLADAIEPLRNFDGVETVRKISYDNIDKGCHKMLVDTMEYLEKEKKAEIDPDTVEAEKWFREFI